MGLDVVELVLDLEDVFKVKLPDAELHDCKTIGDLVDLLMRKNIPNQNPAVSPRQRMSRRVRLMAARRMAWRYVECQESVLLIDLDTRVRPRIRRH